MTSANVLAGYEKGVVARALLEHLIKQGYLEDSLDNDQEFEIRISVKKWYLELLGSISEEVLEAWRERQKLCKNLRKLR